MSMGSGRFTIASNPDDRLLRSARQQLDDYIPKRLSKSERTEDITVVGKPDTYDRKRRISSPEFTGKIETEQ
ncbi:hypothetical protein RR48_01207 [Papilio machaon]|uniref:Uncharacterized protein n=1 Tax=Papilio machaon TaxID=76193 RepID=A0A0N1IIY6_PAPMA|nr:hypothetical protein RR48_01207 [Papilio machaon]